MAFYEHEPEDELHLGETLCLLCRQIAYPGSLILDLRRGELTVPECEQPCLHCQLDPSLRFWTHKLCFDLLRGSYKSTTKPTLDDLRKFGLAVEPRYRPLDEESIDVASSWEGLLSCYARPFVGKKFSPELFEKLPAEIQCMISDFIGPCWYLIVLGETRRMIEALRHTRESQCERLSLTKEVYISWITYQGNSYLTNISNQPLEPQSLHASSQEHVKLPAHVKSVVLSTDHVGVRRIQFVDENSHPSADESPWYEVVELPGSCQELQVVSNGLFIRHVRVLQDDIDDVARTWSSPFPPNFEPWNIYSVYGGRRLDHVKLDDDSVQGLLVCCSRTTNCGIHAFSNTSRSFNRFVTLMNKRVKWSPCYWFYFPINTGELIEAAWVRRYKDLPGPDSNPALVIQTTFGRTATFGPQIPAHLRGHYEYLPLVKDSDGAISGIIHDGLDLEFHQIGELGVTCNDNHRVITTIPEPPIDTYNTPPVPPNKSAPATVWYLTKAPLKDLLSVRVCRDQEQLHKPCIGMLLYYKGGRVESLGQIRWDRDVSMEVFSPIRIRKGDDNEQDYIKDVQSSNCRYAVGERSDDWQEVSRSGTIIWWVGGHLGDVITIYND